jgi:hypothetical protein
MRRSAPHLATDPRRLRHSPESHPRPPRTLSRRPQLSDGDRYELSGGHPIYCLPAGREHSARNLTGARVLETDPDVEWAGADAGFAPERGMLRAPDIAVGPAALADLRRGWIPGVPPLAVEYASHDQDENARQAKIADLLCKGTRAI